MGPARRVKLSIGMVSARWGLSRRRSQFGRREHPALPVLQPDAASGTVDVLGHEADTTPICANAWPVLATSGSLEVRIAESDYEIEAAQRLRYRIFYEEMSAIPTPQMRAERRDFDSYDSICDHMLVIDRDASDELGEPAVVGTYRLLRGDVAAKAGGFYTSSEYDLSAMFANGRPGTQYLELGRSCVLKAYRAKAQTMQLLWRGIIVYLDRYAIDVMFGCGSLPGTDPDEHKLPLSYLHHYHSAPENQRTPARPELYVPMNRMPKEEIDPKQALRALPPLIKGYVRAGCFIGDGAVIDKQFGTTDVLIYFPVSQIDQRWRSKFARA
jgi:L-ornithine Nalpha-acyltransferase